MKFLSSAAPIFIMHACICVPNTISAASIEVAPQDHSVPATLAVWQSTKAEHIYGFPDIKAHKKGTLTLSADSITFSGKSGNTSIPRSSVTAVSAGNQRVELWGLKGQLLRMAIPQGGGLAAATVMHHRVDMLTVEFRDKRGDNHGAVFFLPAHQADRALQSFTQMPAFVPTSPAPDIPARTVLSATTGCQNAAVEARSMFVATPNWEHSDVPAAYRALVYEHVIDRLRRAKEAGHVYRDGENNGQDVCPQYTIHISIAAFKQGSQVKRAFLGPIGMFVGTTKMTFDTTFDDASGTLNIRKQVKATTRGETENTNVADSVAKTIAKQYASVLKEADKNVIATAAIASRQ